MIDLATVRRIAELAQLELPPDEQARMQRNLSAILDFIEQLNAVPTAGVAPMEHVLNAWGLGPAPEAKLRDDVPAPCLSPAQALAGAPAQLADFFQVPRIVERGERGGREDI